MTSEHPPSASRELAISRILDVPREAVYRCWTDPEIITRWFTPPPWKTIHAELDVRPGGSSLVIMQSPEGQKVPNRGVYLEVVPNERLVATDAYTSAWIPSPRPFMTLVLTFEEAGRGKTRYTARVLHWSDEARAEHERMGFHQGWAIATDQLEATARALA